MKKLKLTSMEQNVHNKRSTARCHSHIWACLCLPMSDWLIWGFSDGFNDGKSDRTSDENRNGNHYRESDREKQLPAMIIRELSL